MCGLEGSVPLIENHVSMCLERGESNKPRTLFCAVATVKFIDSKKNIMTSEQSSSGVLL